MFDKGEDARIPIVAVTGTNGKTTTARLMGNLFEKISNVSVLLVLTAFMSTVSVSIPVIAAARSVLAIYFFHPDVDAAVLETARGGMLREGLGFDRCNVAIVTNIGMGDHLGIGLCQHRGRVDGS